MLRKVHDLENFELRAPDGRIGHVRDFLFDDRRWHIRYLVIETGGWLSQRPVLIAPASVHPPDWNRRAIPVDLTREQVRNSPPLDTETPVSREQEMALIRYYDWPMYWAGSGLPDGFLYTTPALVPSAVEQRRAVGPGTSSLDEPHHIRSVQDVRGYVIEANDGVIGHVEDFIADDHTWTIQYLLIDTRNGWPGRRVLVSPEWIFDVGWNEAKVFVDVTREAVRSSPEYDPSVPPTADYADQLHAHYGQPRRSSEP